MAAVLYLEPPVGQHQAGDTIIQEIRIDNEQECINAVEVGLSFPPDILEAVDFSQGGSILSLWVEPPKIEQSEGKVTFAGGVPGGYCGNDSVRTPGDGIINLLGKIIFRVKDSAPAGPVNIDFMSNSRVLLHNGYGDRAKLTVKGATFEVLPSRAPAPRDQWQLELAKDHTSPEDFSPEILREPTIFNGQYFLIFSTTDKQTGLSYYEVSEQKRLMAGVWEPQKWVTAKSPYLLRDQSLRSRISVRAVDKAGNARLAVIFSKLIWLDFLPWMIIILIIGIFIAWLLYKKLRGGKSKIKKQARG